MKNKDWKIPFNEPDVPKELTDAGYNPLLAATLALRGIRTAEEAAKLINSESVTFYDPMLILNMDKAVARIKKAMECGETVAVYGDYDVDGITATCLVTDYLRTKGVKCIPYIPDRAEEGYGLNCSAIDTLRKLNVTVIITVDCGITASGETEYARSSGIDMIITDHHECRAEEIPNAAAVVDCRQEGDSYPNPYLAGVGMALKLVCACEGEYETMLERYAEFAAIGTVADVMPLVDENRYIVRMGLEKLKKTNRPGIKAILSQSGTDISKLSASTISFTIAPRLNAAGRLGQVEKAARLLLSENDEEADELAFALCELNRKRQSIETDIWEDANARLAGKVPAEPIILASEQWHQGVIGIAASRLAEQYLLPSIMICVNGSMGKGSCRSYGDFNIFEALNACSEHLIGFGGHALAAGLNIKPEKIGDFRKAMSDYYRNNRPRSEPDIKCDILINNPSMLSMDNVKSLEKLEPFGSMNPKPVMCMYGVQLESLSYVGGGRHMKMRVRMGKSIFECIFFSHNALELGIEEKDYVDMAFFPQINEYHGRVSIQLAVSAMRRHRSEELCRLILEGNDDYIYAACRFTPRREDYVRTWRHISGRLPIGKSLPMVLAQCPTEIFPEKFCLCLAVFTQAGLLRSKTGGIYGGELWKINGKVDLESTQLAKKLWEYRKECDT